VGKKDEEREVPVFKSFLEARGILFDQDSIEKRQPPEPDILFRNSDGLNVAFELVELLDKDYGRMYNILFDTIDEIQRFYENFVKEKKDSFKKKFGDAFLNFNFLQNATFKQRQTAIPKIFEKLLAVSDSFTSEVLEDDPDLFFALKSVSISRGKLNGPIFNPESVGGIGDPTVPKIQQKFTKEYRTQYPIELLAYIDVNPMLPNDIWLESLQEFIKIQSKPFPFQHIWVFDYRNKVVKFECTGE
jgi:hypothetical protein